MSSNPRKRADWVIERLFLILVDVGSRSVFYSTWSDLHIEPGGGVPVTSTKFYSAGGTDDFRQALIYISHRYPKAILLGLAFSLGSNIMTRYISQEGEKCRLSSAAVLANVRMSRLSRKNVDTDLYLVAMGSGSQQRHVSSFDSSISYFSSQNAF